MNFFILEDDLLVKHVFIPRSENLDLTQKYLRFIKEKYFWNTNDKTYDKGNLSLCQLCKIRKIKKDIKIFYQNLINIKRKIQTKLLNFYTFSKSL